VRTFLKTFPNTEWVANGICLSGMPSCKQILADTQILYQ
jgi:hypothetical protein